MEWLRIKNGTKNAEALDSIIELPNSEIRFDINGLISILPAACP